MAGQVERIALLQPAANTDITAFSPTAQYLLSVICTNIGTAVAEVRISVTDGTDTAFIIYDLDIPINDTYETFRFAMAPGDDLLVRSSTGFVSFLVQGIDQSPVGA
jgi:hypothetical protein